MDLFEFNIDDLAKDTSKEEEEKETKLEETEEVEEKEETNLESSQEQEDVEEQHENQEQKQNQEEDFEEQTEVNANPVKDTYDILNDFLPLNEIEDLDEDKLRQELAQEVPQKLFMSYVESRPSILQDLLTYGVNLTEEDAQEKLISYFNKFVKPSDKAYDLDTEEGARQFLLDSEEFKEPFLNDIEEINLTIDRWEDSGKLIENAKKYQDRAERFKAKEKEKLRLEAEARSKEAAQKEVQFRQSLKSEIENMPWDMQMKQKTINALNPEYISQVNKSIQSSPKAIVQLANLYNYFKDGNFDELFNILEGKAESNKNKQVKKTIAQDSLSKRINKNTSTSTKQIKGFVPQLV